jgi:hypothetical protein
MLSVARICPLSPQTSCRVHFTHPGRDPLHHLRVCAILSMFDCELNPFLSVVQLGLLLRPKPSPRYLEQDACVYVCVRMCVHVSLCVPECMFALTLSTPRTSYST